MTAQRSHDRLCVTVADKGVGFPEGFDLDSATSLGLQIVRTLVVGELGGRLLITPRPGGGTEAGVELPVGPEAPHAPARGPGPVGPPGPGGPPGPPGPGDGPPARER